MQILRAGALVVGTGCAGYNAADWLCAYGVPDVCLVTEGREAMGAALIRLRSGGKLYSGQGISTDVIGASIQAYLNALNKIVYEEM